MIDIDLHVFNRRLCILDIVPLVPMQQSRRIPSREASAILPARFLVLDKLIVVVPAGILYLH